MKPLIIIPKVLATTMLATALSLCLPTKSLALGNGYAGGLTGGSLGTAVTVTTATQLATYAQSAATYNITVSGTIDLGDSGKITLKSNKTLHGANSSATVLGTIQTSAGVTNIIIDHLNISANTGAAASNDGITIYGATNVYVTKCTIYDCTDGNLDIVHGSDKVTVSWCKFYYTRDNGHNFSDLIGSSDTDTNPGGYHITFHHNWWSTGCQQRMPADRFGPFHLYNNYWSCTGNYYCTQSRNISQMLAENNYYDTVSNPLAKVESGKLKTSGNIFNNCTGNQMTSSDSVFTPPYGYTLDATANVPSLVTAGAGNR